MFEGFSEATFDFLWGIRFQNEKAWFEAHREEYRAHVAAPMNALASQVYAAMEKTCSKYGLRCKVSRIYRDARRLRGRGPYRDSLWFSLEKPCEDWTHTPVFWFELSPETFTYGLGYYQARPATMAKLRARMDTAPKPMETLARRLNRRPEFVLDGETYKRPKGEGRSRLLQPWYQKKSFSIYHQETVSAAALYTPALADRLVEAFQFLLPFYDYFSTLDGDPDPRGE